jgi:drug/metabolite transporter (DMT)-like permease
LTGIAMAAASAVAFSTIAILGKYAYAAGFSVSNLLALRFCLAALAMTGLCMVVGPPPWSIGRRHLGWLLVLGFACYGMQSALFFAALAQLPASFVELLLYMSPALVVLGSWMFLRHRLGLWLVIAIAVNLIGVILLVGPTQVDIGLPLALAIGVPLSNAAYFLAAEPIMRDLETLPASATVMAAAAVFWVIVALSRGELAVPADGQSWLILAALTIVPSMLGIPLILAAINRIGSARAALVSTIEPVVTVLLAFTLLRETFQSLQAVGAVLILCSAVVLPFLSNQSKATQRELAEPRE